jgi:hypothetical protein
VQFKHNDGQCVNDLLVVVYLGGQALKIDLTAVVLVIVVAFFCCQAALTSSPQVIWM